MFKSVVIFQETIQNNLISKKEYTALLNKINKS